MIILLTGTDQTGKDAFLQFLFEEPFYSDNVERLAFSDVLDGGDIKLDEISSYGTSKYIAKSKFELSNIWIRSIINKLDSSNALIKVIVDIKTYAEYKTIQIHNPGCIVVEINIGNSTPANTNYPFYYTLNSNSETYREDVFNLIETIQLEWLIEYSKQQPAQRSPEWFNLRKGIFTASNCYLIRNPQAKFFGKSLDQLVAEKKSSKLPAPLNTPAIRHGVMFEDVAVRYFTQFLKPGTRHDDAALIFNPRYDKLAASPDGFISNDTKPALIEIKCPSRNKIDYIPEYYNDQMQLQMMMARIPRCYFLAVKFIRASTMRGIPDNAVCGAIRYKTIFHSDDGEIIQSPQMLYENKYYLNDAGLDDGMYGYFFVSDYYMKLIDADVEWQHTFLDMFNKMRERYDI